LLAEVAAQRNLVKFENLVHLQVQEDLGAAQESFVADHRMTAFGNPAAGSLKPAGSAVAETLGVAVADKVAAAPRAGQRRLYRCGRLVVAINKRT
jgi:hypothetical protein